MSGGQRAERRRCGVFRVSDDERPPRECAVCHGEGYLYCVEGCPEHNEECPYCDGTGEAE